MELLCMKLMVKNMDSSCRCGPQIGGFPEDLGRNMLEITMQVLADYFPFLPSPHLHVMQFQTNQSVIANFLFIPFFVI